MIDDLRSELTRVEGLFDGFGVKFDESQGNMKDIETATQSFKDSIEDLVRSRLSCASLAPTRLRIADDACTARPFAAMCQSVSHADARPKSHRPWPAAHWGSTTFVGGHRLREAEQAQDGQGSGEADVCHCCNGQHPSCTDGAAHCGAARAGGEDVVGKVTAVPGSKRSKERQSRAPTAGCRRGAFAI